MYVPQRLHDVRIAVKKLRYAAELADETTGKRITGDVAALKAAPDLLGRLHDLEVFLNSRRVRDRHRWRGPIFTQRGATSGHSLASSKTTAGDYTRVHARDRHLPDGGHANQIPPGTRAAQFVDRHAASSSSSTTETSRVDPKPSFRIIVGPCAAAGARAPLAQNQTKRAVRSSPVSSVQEGAMACDSRSSGKSRCSRCSTTRSWRCSPVRSRSNSLRRDNASTRSATPARRLRHDGRRRAGDDYRRGPSGCDGRSAGPRRFFGLASMLDQTPHQTNAIAWNQTDCLEWIAMTSACCFERSRTPGWTC